jgi:hypothetical protein
MEHPSQMGNHKWGMISVFVGTQKRKDGDMTEKRWSLLVGFHWKWELLVNGRFD